MERHMRSTALVCLLLSLTVILTSEVTAQTEADSAGIRAAALDYIEGWFTGDAERVARALYPELVKRIVVTDVETGRDFIDGMGASKLVEGTRRGYGKDVPVEARRTDISILNVTGQAASVKVDAGPWLDFMHLVRVNGEWKILNVLLSGVQHCTMCFKKQENRDMR
jgi:hypothetical protein